MQGVRRWPACAACSLARRWRLSTKAEHATDEHGVMIGALLQSAGVEPGPPNYLITHRAPRRVLVPLGAVRRQLSWS